MTIDLYKKDRQYTQKREFNKDFKRLCRMKNITGTRKTFSIINGKRRYYNFIAVMAVSIYSNDHFRAQVTRGKYLDYQFVKNSNRVSGYCKVPGLLFV